ncbi:MAG TPA: hypothetical protein VFN67_16745 [Polyangiales bacterium]|nr:hypothetical protein [Polyangiales bacterium]
MSRTLRACWFLGCAVLTMLEQARLVSFLIGRYTNEDHAILWLAASDWMRLRPREPTFYGQSYGENLEAIPIGVMHMFGLSYGTAFPVAMLALALAAWWLLAFGAHKHGSAFAALLAAAAPLLLNVDHWVIVGVIGTGVGRMLAAAAAALILGASPNARTLGWSVAVGSFAIALDSASAMLVVPAFAWACLAWIRVRRFWIPLGLGALPAIAWKGYCLWFQTAHPDHALHSAWTATTSWETFLKNLDDPGPLLSAHALQLHPRGELIVGLTVAFLIISVVARSARAVLSATSLLGLLAALVAMDKSLDNSASLWFSASRMTLIVPMSVWFVGFVSVDALRSRRLSRAPRRWVTGFGYVGLAAIMLATKVDRVHGWKERLRAIEDVGLRKENMPLSKVEEVEERCREANAAALAAQTRIVIYPHNRALAYACPALYRNLLTAHPSYERRAWVLRALSEKVVDRMILWSVEPRVCKGRAFRRGLASCVPIARDRGVLATFAKQPALDVVRRLGFGVRPFGTGCDPVTREGCDWWAARYKN